MSGSARELEAMVAAAQPGAVIELPSGRFVAELIVRVPLTLVGHDTILAGDGLRSLLVVNGDAGLTATVRGVQFVDGVSQRGGAVRLAGDANVVLEACVFERCGAMHAGGALAAVAGSFTVRDSRFVACRARFGGSLFAGHRARADLIGCTFVDSQARQGGVFVAEGSAQVHLRGCTVEGANAEEQGDFGLVAGDPLGQPRLVLRDNRFFRLAHPDREPIMRRAGFGGELEIDGRMQ